MGYYHKIDYWYNELKAANDLAAKEKHRLLMSSLMERAESKLMSNVLQDTERRLMAGGMKEISREATSACVLCAHEAIEKSFANATTCASWQVQVSWTSWRRSAGCSAMHSAASK